MTRTSRIILLFAAAVSLGCADAQNAAQEKRSDKKTENYEDRIQKKTDELSKTLSLTEVQKKAVHQLEKERAEAYRNARDNKSLDFTQKQTRINTADSIYSRKLKSVLTPQQYQKWQAECNSVVMPKGKTAKTDRRYRNAADKCKSGECRKGNKGNCGNGGEKPSKRSE